MITDGKTDDYSLSSNTITTDNAVFNVFKFYKTTVAWPDNQARRRKSDCRESRSIHGNLDAQFLHLLSDDLRIIAPTIVATTRNNNHTVILDREVAMHSVPDNSGPQTSKKPSDTVSSNIPEPSRLFTT